MFPQQEKSPKKKPRREERRKLAEATHKGKEENLMGSIGLGRNWRRGSESNRLIEILQTSAFPFGYHA